MSMINEQVRMLKDVAGAYKHNGLSLILREAADTIEDLSTKLHAANMERSVAYYNSGWIPCSERLPEEPFGCLVTVVDTNPMTMEDFENILPYHVGYDGIQWNDGDGEQIPFEVIAWQPLPEPYKEDDKND